MALDESFKEKMANKMRKNRKIFKLKRAPFRRKAMGDSETSFAVDSNPDTRYQYLVENIQDAVVEFEFVDGEPQVRDVNEAFVEKFGYDHTDICNESLNDWIVPDEHRAEANAIDDQTKSDDVTHQEVVRKTATGLREFLHRSIPYTGSGPVDGIAVYTDITERKRAQQKQQLLTEVSRSLAEAKTLHEGAETTLETLCAYTEWSYGEVWQPGPAGEELRFVVGHADDPAYEPFQEAGREIPFTVGDGLPGRVYGSATSEWFPDVSSEPHEVFHRTDIAKEVGLHAAFGTPVVADGTVVAVLVFFLESERHSDEQLINDVVDVTRNLGTLIERKQAEEMAKRRNEQLEQFTNVISHDLRNPLNVAKSHLEFVAAERDDSHVRQIENAHERIEELIEDVLMLARQGQSVTDYTSLALADCVAQSWAMVTADEASLTIETTRTVRGDESRVKQLFENLFRNAIEHGPDDVSLTVGETQTGFYVADDGPGIPADKRDSVFELGHTTHDTGTGLGLPIVKEIADAHGWTVTVTESEHGGARFDFRI